MISALSFRLYEPARSWLNHSFFFLFRPPESILKKPAKLWPRNMSNALYRSTVPRAKKRCENADEKCQNRNGKMRLQRLWRHPPPWRHPDPILNPSGPMRQRASKRHYEFASQKSKILKFLLKISIRWVQLELKNFSFDPITEHVRVQYYWSRIQIVCIPIPILELNHLTKNAEFMPFDEI